MAGGKNYLRARLVNETVLPRSRRKGAGGAISEEISEQVTKDKKVDKSEGGLSGAILVERTGVISVGGDCTANPLLEGGSGMTTKRNEER